MRLNWLFVIFSSLIFLTSFKSCTKTPPKPKDMKMISSNIKDSSVLPDLFPKTIAEINTQADYAMKTAQEKFKNVLEIPAEQRTFENTAHAYDSLQSEFIINLGAVAILETVEPDDALRKAYHDSNVKLRQFFVEAFFKPEIYTAFKEYFDGNAKKENLNAEEQYYLDESMRDFVRHGFNLPAEKFELVKNLEKELSELATNFEANINQDNSFLTLSKEELSGVSENLLSTLEKDKSGKYIVRCDYPTRDEISTNCKNAATRKQFYLMFANKAYPKNIEILQSFVAKNDTLAHLLGFESFAALEIDSQMAKTPKTVETFLNDLAKRSLIKAKNEIDLFTKEIPESVTLTNDGKIEPWDMEYIKNHYKKQHLQLDENKVAEYFPAEKTIDGIFEIYQQFLGLDFKIYKPTWAWHEDVKLIEIHDKANKELKGFIYLDLYPRPNKYAHACMWDFIPTLKIKQNDGSYKITPSVSVIVANFPKSTSTQPSLLKHRDVETFFHEFGHTMHHLLGSTEIASFSGTGVKRDFVEVPSQMFEEWMFDHDMLKKITRHYKTNEPMPDELIEKLIALKKFDSGLFLSRQCGLSFIALNYYKQGAKKDLDEIVKQMTEKYTPHLRFEPQTHMQYSWGHLTGYGSKYYGYMWAKVFSLDIFYKIKEHGLLNENIGRQLTEKVIGVGGSADPNILLKDFLGREPNSDALFEDLGIK